MSLCAATRSVLQVHNSIAYRADLADSLHDHVALNLGLEVAPHKLERVIQRLQAQRPRVQRRRCIREARSVSACIFAVGTVVAASLTCSLDSSGRMPWMTAVMISFACANQPDQPVHLPTCTFPLAPSHLHLPTCTFPLARSHLHLPTCTFPLAHSHLRTDPTRAPSQRGSARRGEERAAGGRGDRFRRRAPAVGAR